MFDIHCPGSTKQNVTFLEAAGSVPYRSLYTKEISNLLAAGRCISADEDAFASIRVQAPVMAVGQAAGTAAALCAKAGVLVSELPFGELKAALLAQGAIL